MLSYGLTGSGVHDESVRFRMYLVVVVGIFAFGSVLYWRSELLRSSDYYEMPKKLSAKHIKAANPVVEIE